MFSVNQNNPTQLENVMQDVEERNPPGLATKSSQSLGGLLLEERLAKESEMKVSTSQSTSKVHLDGLCSSEFVLSGIYQEIAGKDCAVAVSDTNRPVMVLSYSYVCSDLWLIVLKILGDDPLIYEKLVSSLAPSIWEMEDVKKGVLCQLFGGTIKVAPESLL